MIAIREFSLDPLPLPCEHDQNGIAHTSLSQMLACVERYGVPGFRVRRTRRVR